MCGLGKLINKRFFPRSDDFMFSLICPVGYKFLATCEKMELREISSFSVRVLIYSVSSIRLCGLWVLQKREFTSFDVAAVVRELKEAILDSRVNNVYQLDGKTLLLKLHETDKPALNLVLGAGRRLHLTSYASEKPQTPPAFCMALRKYLRNARLTSIEQYEFERVVLLNFETKEGKMRLVLELFGDGNLILVGENGRILQALHYKRMRDRNILRNEAFQFAPSSGKNPSKVSRQEFLDGLRGFGDVEVVRAAARFLSTGGMYAEEALSKAGVDKTKKCSELSEVEIGAVYDSLQGLLSQVVSGVLEPCIVLNADGSFADVVPFKLVRYEGSGFKLQPCSSFNEALDEFYVRVIAVEKALAGVEIDQLKREAERLKRIVADQEKVVAEAEASAPKEKQVGDTIYAYSVEMQALLDKFSAGKQNGKEWNTTVSEILAEKKANIRYSALFESFDARNLIISVCVDGLRFGLNLRKSLFENAAEFYELGKRAKQKMAGAKTALEESQKALAEVETKIREAEVLEQAKPAEAAEELVKLKVKHKEWFEKFRWFVSSDGFLVVAGKDAVSNEVLVKKYAEPDDVVFHADITGAPFVVIKTSGKQPSEQVLREAGEFAAAFSRGWREGFGSVDVYWVKPEQLSKSGPSGEYVGHGAFVVNGKRNWMRNVPLKVAVGIVTEENEIDFIGGPIDAVKAKAKAYIVVAPGDYAGKELLGQILRLLGGKTPREQRERIVKTSIENIRGFVPYGVGKLLES
jgi:predicted ribosome quality control (RQC) complex YloA/Tae2 family protein